MKYALLLTLLAACGRINFGPYGDDNSGSTDGGDAAVGVDSNLATSCITPADNCAFNGVGPCSCWGGPSITNANLTENNGALHITPMANTAGAQGSCANTNVPLTSAGVFVEVSTAAAGMGELLTLQLGAGTDKFSILTSNGMLSCGDGTNSTMTPYDPVAHRWWRIRPVATGAVFEVSSDGHSWNLFATSTHTMSASYDVTITDGEFLAEPAPATAVIEGINVCPP